MCRYGEYGPYKRHLACFDCRKAFKPAAFQQHLPRRPDDPAPCPDCGRPMADMGLDFQAPRRADVEGWAVARALFRRGIAFHSCGCGGPGVRPRRRRDLPPFLAATVPRPAGAVLAARFADRANSPRRHGGHGEGHGGRREE